MSRWMKLVFVNPDRVRSDEESVHLLFDMTDPAQEGEVRRLREELAEVLEMAGEYHAGRHGQVVFPWAMAGRCEACGQAEPCARCCGAGAGAGHDVATQEPDVATQEHRVRGSMLSIVPDQT